jgi:hypothetical protein
MVQRHDSFMSASDAAPLPRLGEVFFDVRGSSRSMRLSWYADTGVAVFSIWQGGMCTGTFRLPIGDLPRMVEILQAGPHGRGLAASGHAGGPGGAGYGGHQDFPTGSVLRPGAGDGYPDDYPREPGPGYGRDEPPGPRRGGYPPDEPREPARVAYGQDPLEFAEPGGGRYGRDAFPGDRPDYRAERQAETWRGAHGPADGPQTFDAGYGEERFVPPYVQNPPGEYGNDIPARAADVPTGPRHGAYRDERPASRSPAEEYQEPQWAPADYSDGPRYR